MKWLGPSLIAISGALALAILSPFSHSGADSTPPAPHTAASAPDHPDDGIRTDLGDYAWPTDAGRLVTSTFGEYRRTHFHGGIDVSTGDQTGYKVFASRAGDISRVRVDAEGYGKILFVRHADGYTTSYAHLRGFAPAIERRVRNEQLRLQRYTVHLELARGELPVRKGELIAYTGETGSGSPHLHFEIRDLNGNGVNPLLAPRLRVQDDIPPVFRKIAFVPLGTASSVNEAPDAVSAPVRLVRPRTFTFTAPVTITGAAGIGVYVRDSGNGTHYPRGVYRHRLFIDGKLFFEVRLDRLPMRESQQIGLYYIRDLLHNGEGRFEKLFVDCRHTLSVYSDGRPGAGWLSTASLPPGTHNVSILSQDFSGNTAELSGTIRLLAAPPEVEAGEANGRVNFSTSPPGHAYRLVVEGKQLSGATWTFLDVPVEWTSPRCAGSFELPPDVPGILRVRAVTEDGAISPPVFVILHPQPGPAPTVRLETEITPSGARVMLSSDGVFTTPPVVSLEEGSRRLLRMTASDERHYRAVFTPADSITGRRSLVFEGNVNGTFVRVVKAFELYPVLPGRSGSFSFDEGRLKLDYDSLSVYDTLYLQVQLSSADGIRTYDLLPERAILREGFTVTMRTDRPSAKQALYTRGGGEWSLLARPGDQANPFTARLTDRLASLALLTDTEGPVIRDFRFMRRKRSDLLAHFRFSDALSGVDYKELKAYIDGKFVVPEIDGEHRRATVVAPEGLTRGSHRLQLRVRDRMGNSSFLEREFIVP